MAEFSWFREIWNCLYERIRDFRLILFKNGKKWGVKWNNSHNTQQNWQEPDIIFGVAVTVVVSGLFNMLYVHNIQPFVSSIHKHRHIEVYKW